MNRPSTSTGMKMFGSGIGSASGGPLDVGEVNLIKKKKRNPIFPTLQASNKNSPRSGSDAEVFVDVESIDEKGGHPLMMQHQHHQQQQQQHRQRLQQQQQQHRPHQNRIRNSNTNFIPMRREQDEEEVVCIDEDGDMHQQQPEEDAEIYHDTYEDPGEQYDDNY